jgi:hypothetical protein
MMFPFRIGDDVVLRFPVNGAADPEPAPPSPVPEEYTELSYIQSSGEQWISPQMRNPALTDVVRIQTRFAFVSIDNNWQAVVSVDNYHTGSVYASYCLYFGADSSGFLVKVSNPAGTDATDASPQITPATNTEYDADITVGAESTSVTVDGASFVSTIAHGMQHGLMLFANRAAYNYGYSSFASIKMYYCKIYVNDVLVHDLVPCKRNSDDEIGMYDIVADEFLTNGGSGSFMGG